MSLHNVSEDEIDSYQDRVGEWMKACFGHAIAADGTERNHRFLEEGVELVQSLGCTEAEAHLVVSYVFGRPKGEPFQETGGVMVTLAALCNAHNLDMPMAGEVELTRVWMKVDQIRAKQAAKPKFSPLAAEPSRYRHVKSGGLYELVLTGTKIEANGEDAVVYRSVATGQAWVRPTAEFFDGRFEKVTS
jgi:hypothetical protein